MIINKNADEKILKNNILALANEAAKAKKADPEVINGTSGMLKNEDGSLHEFECVKKVVASLTTNEKYAYANSGGSKTFSEAVYYSLFGKYLEEIRKSAFIKCIPTPGGTGGLHLAFSNYVERGETVLLPNHMWENYLNMGKEMGFNTDTYQLFNEKDEFDIEDLNSKINSLKDKQNRILFLINDPCENPTGFCMKDQDYDELIAIAKYNPNNQFVYLIDVAYFDFYNINPDIIRSRYAKFKDIPSNALALFVFSGSKSFGLYGLRIGALVALSKDEKEAQLFKDASSYSSRAKWSAASTLGMSIIEKLVLDEQNRLSYEEEIKYVYSMLEKRSIAFLNAAKEVGLKTLPYERGFFICVPTPNPNKIMEALHLDKVHIVCTRSCLRIALCAINKEEAARLPKLIKNRLDEE